ncbi:hypothetical protein Hanom_Chr17g01564061 [Helianthus anomalus]
MCIGIQRPRGLNRRLFILCKVLNVTFRHKPTCKRSLCIYSYGVVGFMKKWSRIWIRVFKKALGQFHDYFKECSTKFYYIV